MCVYVYICVLAIVCVYVCTCVYVHVCTCVWIRIFDVYIWIFVRALIVMCDG